MDVALPLHLDAAGTRGEPRLPALPKDTDAARLRRAALEFEAAFLGQMLQPMLAGLGAEKPFGGGLGEDIWRAMLADEYGKAIARAGGIGLADAVVRGVLGAQELRAETGEG